MRDNLVGRRWKSGAVNLRVADELRRVGYSVTGTIVAYEVFLVLFRLELLE